VIAYFDASSLVKLFKQEDGRDEAVALWHGADVLITSQLTYAETRSALRRAVRSGAIERAAHPAIVHDLDDTWTRLLAFDVDAQTSLVAGELVDRHDLRGADAIHLSTALAARGEDFVFVTWDRRLAQGALAEGLPVAPA
jgi:predicted nucleic acid-binding protein